MKARYDYSGRTVFVSGGTSGINLGIADAYAQAGARVAVMSRNAERVAVLMRETYGPDAALWTRRWRRFYLATAGLFGNDEGRTWAVSHYLLKPAGEGLS